MATFHDEQEIRLRDRETNIKKEVGEAFEKKTDSISVTVANHVATQLMGLFKQYLSPNEFTDTSKTLGGTVTPMITQEVRTSPVKLVKTIQDQPAGYHRHLQGTDTAQMLEAINEIDTTLIRSCSPHDTTYVQSLDPC